MMNVNFFEKKKINLLPYILGVIFVVLLLLIAGYFYMARTNYEATIEEKNTWLSEHAEAVVLSRQISQLDGLANESVTVQENLKNNQFPMNALATDLAATVPNENERISSFHILDANQVTLILEHTAPTMAQTIVENLEEKPYVADVHFLHAENQNAEDNEARFEMIINLNAENLIVGEETE